MDSKFRARKGTEVKSYCFDFRLYFKAVLEPLFTCMDETNICSYYRERERVLKVELPAELPNAADAMPTKDSLPFTSVMDIASVDARNIIREMIYKITGSSAATADLMLKIENNYDTIIVATAATALTTIAVIYGLSNF
jgi:hypothetical protein